MYFCVGRISARDGYEKNDNAQHCGLVLGYGWIFCRASAPRGPLNARERSRDVRGTSGSLDVILLGAVLINIDGWTADLARNRIRDK